MFGPRTPLKAVLTASGSSIELNLLLISFLFVDIAIPLDLFGKPYFPVLGSEKLLSYLTFSIQCWGGKREHMDYTLV